MDEGKRLLLLFIGVLFIGAFAMVLPFLQYFLLAVMLAYVLAPLQNRFEARVGPRTAAASLVTGTTVVLILPLILVLREISADAGAVLRQIREGDLVLAQVEDVIARELGAEVNLAEFLRPVLGVDGRNTVGNLISAFGLATNVLIGLGLTAFLLYFFLKDGDKFTQWLQRTVPIPDDVRDELFQSIDAITRAVLLGHVLVAIVQGVMAGIGLVAVGLPNALFWTAVMIVLAIMPIVGSFLVWGPAVGYLVVIGRPVAAVFLFGYGTVLVGVSDDYLRPIIVNRYARVNPSVIIIGVLGGLSVIGVMGIFIGPIIIGVLRKSIDVFREAYLQPAG